MENSVNEMDINAQQAFVKFVKCCLIPEKADRFAKLSETKNGQRKILDSLNHHFESAIRSNAIRSSSYDKFLDSPCFVFHSPLGFGAEFDSVREAYDKLSIEDGWLILLRDGSIGIHRPEARWDDEKLIADQLTFTN
ncbi:MAG TPA: hypothetical protein VN516_02840, partial [Candidatus Baltobacteraceae bacterium]|nr:hypothetical protein [Candidatus Baltobacteraceae bacterium]